MNASHIVIASGNLEKARLLKKLLQDASGNKIRASTLFDKTLTKDQTAVKTVLEEIQRAEADSPLDLATKKAALVAQALSLPAIGEETLLTIPILGSDDFFFREKQNPSCSPREPSPGTAQLHSSPRSQALKHEIENILRLLKMYSSPEDRAASLASYIAYVCPLGVETKTSTARTEGYIGEQESGRRTYDYGSLFIKHEYSKTLSELSESVAERISHRKKAIEALVARITQKRQHKPTAGLR